MKNSDMKVVAIILSIALFFTIITSNAVSVASVVLLAKDGGSAQSETVAPDAGATTPATPVAPDAGTPAPQPQTPDTPAAPADTTAPAGDSSTADTTAAPAGDSGSADTTAAPAGDAGADSSDPVMKDPLAFYQKAAQNEKKTAAQGFTKIAYQSVEAIDIGAASKVLMPVLESFMTKEDKAKANATPVKGEDAKGVFPASNFTKGCVKSATAVKQGEDYKVTIVFNDQAQMTKKDADGLHVATCWDLLYIEDVTNTVQNDATVKKVVKSLNQGTLVYKNFTIVAVMTKDGKFKSIDMDGTGDIVADATIVLIGDIHGTGTLGFHIRYYDFTK